MYFQNSQLYFWFSRQCCWRFMLMVCDAVSLELHTYLDRFTSWKKRVFNLPIIFWNSKPRYS